MNSKTDIDYLNYTDLNEIENKIEELTNEISQLTDIPEYQKREWIIGELPYIQEIDIIEKGITNIGEYFYKPEGWLPTKEWITKDNPYPIKSFSYRDWNRWVNNLNIINLADIDKLTLWNGPSQVEWNVESQYEWEEI